MRILCFFGFHDWRVRERMMDAKAQPGCLPPINIMRRWRQCRRCNKTSWYVPEADPPAPEPMPWEGE